MTLETFFEKFDTFADSPDAVAKMREFVLRMATSGRIADQDPADQPASDLLKEIFKIRDDLIKRGEAKSRSDGNPISAGDTIDIPPTWTRCMISEVCDLQTGATPSRTEHRYFGGDIPWLVSGDINKGEITDCEGRITKDGLKNSNCKIIPKNSVLIALNGQGKTRATVAVLRIPAALNQSLVAMIPYSGEHLLPEYVYWNLRGRYYSIRDITGQDQRRGLNMKLVGQLSLPIPPLAEQKRIVAKVDELMALCDRLEAQQQERDTRHAELARASLARFAEAPTPANLQFLFHKSYPIPPADLRKSILTLAPRGRLVEQLKAEGVVEPNSGVSFSPAELPYELPDGWAWKRLGDLVEFIGGSQPPKAKFIYEPREGYTRFIQIRDFKSDANLTFIPTPLANRPFNEDDVMIGRYGPPVFQILRGLSGTYNVALMKAEPISKLISKDFLFYLLQEPRIQDRVIAESDRTAGQSGVRKPLLHSFIVAIPPLAEQRRIVAKVEQLMALVDELETQLAASRATAKNLLDAIVAELTAR